LIYWSRKKGALYDDYDAIIDNQEKMVKKATKDYEKAMEQMKHQIQGIGK